MKHILLGLVLTTSCQFAYAKATKIDAAAIENCKATDNDIARLACYDALFADKQLSPQAAVLIKEAKEKKAPPAHAAQKAEKAEKAENTNKRDFGLEHKQYAEAEENSIVAIATSVSRSKLGELTIVLDNGQHWKQIGSESFRLNENDKVEINRGVFNSFLLKRVDANRSIRVKRVE
jgi:hypothetical protein